MKVTNYRPIHSETIAISITSLSSMVMRSPVKRKLHPFIDRSEVAQK